jgi:hypothetical protein
MGGVGLLRLRQVKTQVKRFAAGPAYRDGVRTAGQGLLKLGGAAEALDTPQLK